MNKSDFIVSRRGQGRLAKLLRSRRNERARLDSGVGEGWSGESQLPTLRGYPIDQFYANRNNR